MKSEVDYRIYEEVWSSVMGEVLVCHCDTHQIAMTLLPLLHIKAQP